MQSNLDINEDESLLLVNGNDRSSTRTYNGEHRKHSKLSLDNIQASTKIDQGTSTRDLSKNLRDQSTSTEDLSGDICDVDEDTRRSDDGSECTEDKNNYKDVCEENNWLSSENRRELFKTKSSPSIMKGI